MIYLIVIFLISLSALFSGLTLGFFSLNKDDLKRKAELGDWAAKKIYRLRRDGNLLLCTLLIGNVAVNAALSIFLGSLTSGFAAGLMATGLIVIFGEIMPQAIFARHALKLGARFTGLVRFFVIILFPVTWPIARALDKILGKEMPMVYSKKELIKLIEEHEDLTQSEIDEDEERIIKGALSFSDKTVADIMTPRTEMFALPAKQKLNRRAMAAISRSGYSRIPVYEQTRDNIVGLLYVKDLIGGGWEKKTAGQAARKNVLFVESDKKLDELLNNFKESKQHLFIVLDKFGSVIGLVTIEDILEEIIGIEIMDEYDRHEDLQKRAQERMREKKIT
jgi:metal transporter CNNM